MTRCLSAGSLYVRTLFGIFSEYLGTSLSNFLAVARASSTYAQAGKMEEARATTKKLLKRAPTFSLKRPKKVLTYKDPADKQRIISNLRKAGVPE